MLEIEGFRQHVQTATTQYEQVRELKSNLEPLKEVTCQMDYSENWAGKYPEEITSVYFDNDQISLHPMVLHYKDEQGELQTKSYVGISPDTTHTMPCTYAFIAGLLGRVLDTLPNLNTIHFITDSPSSQYRNRNVIELVRRFPNLFGGMIATWNWLESGHGKGPCDGVGGSIKKKADNPAKEFTKVLNAAGVKSVLFLVPQHEMFDRKEEVKLWRSPPANGVMAMHTITMRDGRMFMRKTLCFKSCCWSHGKPVLNCEGWRTCYGPKVQSSIVQREMTEESVDNVPVEDDMALADLREKTQEVVPVEDDMPLAKRRKKKKEVVPGEDDMPLAKRRKKTQEVVPGEDDMPLADLREKTQQVVPGEDDMPLADLREKTQQVVPGEDDMPLADLREKTQQVVPGEDDMPLADLREKTQQVVPGEDDMPLADLREKTQQVVPGEDDMPLADLREKTQQVVPGEDDMPLADLREKTQEVVPGEDDMPLADLREKTQQVVPGEDDMPLADLREKTQQVVPGEDDMPLADLREKTQQVVPGEDDMPLADLREKKQQVVPVEDDMPLAETIKIKQEVDSEENDMPLAEIIKIKQEVDSEEDRQEKRKTSIKAGDFLIVIFENQWYPVKVLGRDTENDRFKISYMCRERGHWRWGPKDLGSVHIDAIFERIDPPTNHGRNWQLRPHDLQKVKRSFKDYVKLLETARGK